MGNRTLAAEVASMIDHSLLQPVATDDDLVECCAIARKWGVATVCVKPYSVMQAAQLLQETTVRTCTVVGFPHGSSHASVKEAEARQAISDGASEIDMVVNIGKVLGDDWEYVAREVNAVQAVCSASGAILKVIFENDYIPGDERKIRLTQLCRDAGVAFVKTSTGYGYIKQPNGFSQAGGATVEDCKLMVEHAGPLMKVKAAGSIRTLSDLLCFRAVGVARIGTSATDAILSQVLGQGV